MKKNTYTAVCCIDIRDQLIEAAKNNELSISDEEFEDMQNMDDSQLAALAYFTFSLTDETLVEDDEDIELDEDAYTWKYIKDCLFEAVGVNIITDANKYINGTKNTNDSYECFANSPRINCTDSRLDRYCLFCL